MRRLTLGTTTAILVLSTNALYGQSRPTAIGAEAVFGVARRSPDDVRGATEGFQLLLRAGLRLNPYLRVVGAGSLTTFPDEPGVVPLCPSPGNGCGTDFRVPGLGLAGLAVGLQPSLPVGPLQVRLTALGGGYWLYHHGLGLPGLAPGFEGALSLALPVGQRIHVLLEGRLLRLRGDAEAAGKTRNLGAGIAIN